jgi:type IV pilus assembly protein PilZ
VTRARTGAKRGAVSDDQTKPSEPPPSERRRRDRIDVTWSVDCETEDTFLYANITNISEMGIFVHTHEPLEVGTRLTLRFAPPDLEESFVLAGQVQWVNPIRMLAHNPNPGMGIRFVDLVPEDRERLISAVRTIAYVRDAAN